MSNDSAAMLVHPPELEAWFGDGRKLAVLDCRPVDGLVKERLPQSVPFNAYDFFVTDTSAEGLRQFHADMTELVRSAGVDGDETVVVYEDSSGMRAARALWLLDYLGHPDVRLLDGGIIAFHAEGGTTEHAPASPSRRGAFAADPRPQLLATAEYLQGRLNSDGVVLLDVRDAREYTGQYSEDCCPRAGRIPGANWFYWENLLTRRGTFRGEAEMRAELLSRGIDPNREVITYCHRGARAASTYLALRSLGYRRVRNYIGSWHDWSRRLDLPIAIGAPWERTRS